MAKMYVNGVAPRKVVGVLKELGLENVPANQVSRVTRKLDARLQAWRERKLGKNEYLMLDARYNKARIEGVAHDRDVVLVAVLVAVGVSASSGRRRVLGVQVSVSKAAVHWKEFCAELIERGLHGVKYVVTNNHAGLRKAAREMFAGVLQQRCQFHLSQNAIQHAPNMAWRHLIGKRLREEVWQSNSLEQAEQRLRKLGEECMSGAPKLAQWLEENIPEGFLVYKLPPEHRVSMRTTNMLERAVNQEIKRRTRLVRVFPNESSLLFLVSALLVEIDEKWETERKPYLAREQFV